MSETIHMVINSQNKLVLLRITLENVSTPGFFTQELGLCVSVVPSIEHKGIIW